MKKQYKNIFLCLSGAFSFIISLILFIKSKEVWADEWGTDISFNNDYVFTLILSLIVVAVALISMFEEKVNISANEASIYGKLSFTCLSTLYPLGVFFKALFKAISKGKDFDFASYQVYLYFGITFLFAFVSFLFEYLGKNKENN